MRPTDPPEDENLRRATSLYAEARAEPAAFDLAALMALHPELVDALEFVHREWSWLDGFRPLEEEPGSATD